ncbi:uncharacterized protein LOC119397054 [Rhipicephalus sanguineus]|uniref:uncharacterized protein LOC119397054 n=1 Tax=Rhipicephalus sanguineus TaxID=34632 RepID=UPI00189602E3|nr:uncharacterized protein LOC119397054 [Rhipicephalus sanguineus]
MDGQDDEYYASYDSYRMTPQCKLLETIYENPKLSTNGRKQFTSIRKYKRFIDFTVGPTATKKWKRSQKARKLASSRLVHAFGTSNHYDDPQHSLRPVRNARARTPPSYENRSISQECSEVRTRPLGVFKTAVAAASGRVCETDDESARHECHDEPRVVPVCTGTFELPETFVVSSTDLIVEEAATVELPLDCRNKKEDTLGIDFNMDCRVHEYDENVSSGESTITSWCYALPCPETEEDQVTVCYSGGDTPQAFDCRNGGFCEKSPGETLDETVPSKGFYTVCDRRPLHAWAACQEDDVSNTVMELVAVVETAHSLCDSVVKSSGACGHQNSESCLLSQAVEPSNGNVH